MLRTNTLKCFVIKPSFHNYNVLVHMQNHMDRRGRVIIIICDYIQNYDM